MAGAARATARQFLEAGDGRGRVWPREVGQRLGAGSGRVQALAPVGCFLACTWQTPVPQTQPGPGSCCHPGVRLLRSQERLPPPRWEAGPRRRTLGACPAYWGPSRTPRSGEAGQGGGWLSSPLLPWQQRPPPHQPLRHGSCRRLHPASQAMRHGSQLPPQAAGGSRPSPGRPLPPERAQSPSAGGSRPGTLALCRGGPAWLRAMEPGPPLRAPATSPNQALRAGLRTQRDRE